MLDQTLSLITTFIRFGRATAPGRQLGPRPEASLVLYEYEGCPMCRRVREALTDLALPAEIRPCPKGGTRFRPEAESRSGRRQFPYLEDPNTGVALLESTDIVRYLYATYGSGPPPQWLMSRSFTPSSLAASLTRAPMNVKLRTSELPGVPLRLYGAEAHPGARRVRERLCVQELSYGWLPGDFRLEDDAAGLVLTDVTSALTHLRRYESDEE